MHHLTLYGRSGCHLCAVMLDELEPLCRPDETVLEHVDVDSSAELTARYGHRVPVLAIDGEEVCQYRLDPEQIAKRLGY